MNMIPHEFHKPAPLKRMFDDNIKQVTSRIKIYDNMNNLRFFASLEQQMQHVPDDKFGYVVQVTSFCFGGNPPQTILKKFFEFLPDAQKYYNEIVKRYSRIAKAETIDAENIDLYAFKINYKCTKSCCATCKFCKPQFLDPKADAKIDCYHLESYYNDTHLYQPYRGRLVCTNKKLFEPRGVINDLDEYPERDHNSYNNRICNEGPITIYPVVSPECICDFYEEDRNSWRRYLYYNNNPHTIRHLPPCPPSDKGRII